MSSLSTAVVKVLLVEPGELVRTLSLVMDVFTSEGAVPDAVSSGLFERSATGFQGADGLPDFLVPIGWNVVDVVEPRLFGRLLTGDPPRERFGEGPRVFPPTRFTGSGEPTREPKGDPLKDARPGEVARPGDVVRPNDNGDPERPVDCPRVTGLFNPAAGDEEPGEEIARDPPRNLPNSDILNAKTSAVYAKVIFLQCCLSIRFQKINVNVTVHRSYIDPEDRSDLPLYGGIRSEQTTRRMGNLGSR
mmetsp:Transcript_43590/g.70770  ORF Transcript_43590/g.70770 Transcript_43590/m.70770 type:complete len:247 (+) Transcript_43590:2435-3175(+)